VLFTEEKNYGGVKKRNQRRFSLSHFLFFPGEEKIILQEKAEKREQRVKNRSTL
jgi:hypothetical protein